MHARMYRISKMIQNRSFSQATRLAIGLPYACLRRSIVEWLSQAIWFTLNIKNYLFRTISALTSRIKSRKNYSHMAVIQNALPLLGKFELFLIDFASCLSDFLDFLLQIGITLSIQSKISLGRLLLRFNQI